MGNDKLYALKKCVCECVCVYVCAVVVVSDTDGWNKLWHSKSKSFDLVLKSILGTSFVLLGKSQ